MRVPLARRGGLQLLLALRSGEQDPKVKALALDGVFAILESEVCVQAFAFVPFASFCTSAVFDRKSWPRRSSTLRWLSSWCL
jgi:hypothetical protein